MLTSESIVALYTNTLLADMYHFRIADESVRIGVESMKEVYKPKKTASRSTVADFNDVAHRCAYLHKYAALHTVMVRDMLFAAVKQNYHFFHDLVFNEQCFKICSLGGGPGSDVIGAMVALHSLFSYFPMSVSVVDYMENWSYSFNSILRELGSGLYGAFGKNASEFLQWRYVGANLLKSLTPEVELALSTASLVTMIKFVSATSCKDTEFMVKNIFNAMKPGAVLLFIDNDGGGFHELIIKTAEKYKFVSVFGPHRHENYVNELVKAKRFGSISCHKTTVAVHMLQKPHAAGPCYTPYSGYSERRVLLEASHGSISQEFSCNPPFDTPFPPAYSRIETRYNYYSPLQSTPLTPCVFQLNSNVEDRRDVVIADSPNNRRRIIISPETPRAPKRSRHACLPINRVKHWRHHLSSKFNTFKSRVNSALHRNRQKKLSKFKCKSTDK